MTPDPHELQDAEIYAMFDSMSETLSRHNLPPDQVIELFAVYFVMHILKRLPVADYQRACNLLCQKIVSAYDTARSEMMPPTKEPLQ